VKIETVPFGVYHENIAIFARMKVSYRYTVRHDGGYEPKHNQKQRDGECGPCAIPDSYAADQPCPRAQSKKRTRCDEEKKHDRGDA
jgi:hypothetical protein